MNITSSPVTQLCHAAGRMVDQTCPVRDVFDGDREEERRIEGARRETNFDRMARESAQGGKDRDAARFPSGIQPRDTCGENLVCNDANTCRPRPTNSKNCYRV